LKNNESVT